MAMYTCEQCGMSVGTMTCGACGAELAADTVKAGTVAVATCPNGHGMIKSPVCCGQEMSCQR